MTIPFDPLTQGLDASAPTSGMGRYTETQLEEYRNQFGRSMNQQFLLGQAQNAIDRTIYRTQDAINYAVQGSGLAINPLQFGSTLGTILRTQQNYEMQSLQNRAGFNAGTFDQGRLDAMAPTLRGMGFNKGDLQQYMKQMASLSMEVSKNLDKATLSVMAFAKANGLDAGQMTAYAGMIAGGSNVKVGSQGMMKLLAQFKGMAGGNGELVPQYANAYLEMQGVVNASGQTANKDNLTRVMAGLQKMDPFFSTAEGVKQMAPIIAHTEQVGEYNPVLLLRAQQRLRRQQGFEHADLIDTAAQLEANNPGLMAGLTKDLGSGPMGLYMLLTHQMSGGVLEMFRHGAGRFGQGAAAGASYNPLDMSDTANFQRAFGATTDVEKTNAGLINALQELSGKIKWLNDHIAALTPESATGALISGAVGGLSSFAGSTLVSMLGFKYMSKATDAIKVAADAAEESGGTLGTVAKVGIATRTAAGMFGWVPPVALGLATVGAGVMTYEDYKNGVDGSIGNYGPAAMAQRQQQWLAGRQARLQSYVSDALKLGATKDIALRTASARMAFEEATGSNITTQLSSVRRSLEDQAALVKRNVGAAPDSEHLTGNAADIKIFQNGKDVTTTYGRQLSRFLSHEGLKAIPELLPGEGTGTHVHAEVMDHAAAARTAEATRAMRDTATAVHRLTQNFLTSGIGGINPKFQTTRVQVNK